MGNKNILFMLWEECLWRMRSLLSWFPRQSEVLPDEDKVEEMIKRAEVNDAASVYVLANCYHQGLGGLQQNHAKTMELLARAADLGHSKAHYSLAGFYYEGGDMKKDKFHKRPRLWQETKRRDTTLDMEHHSGNNERAIKHVIIAAAAGCYCAMNRLNTLFEDGAVRRESIDSTLKAYNISCAEMRSEARDAYIRAKTIRDQTKGITEFC